MAERKYLVEFLPAAVEDLREIVRYISHDLGNPEAAYKLADEVAEAADGLADFPYKNAIYIPLKPLRHEYRKLPVQNYNLFYWADEGAKIITIARVIYTKRNYGKVL